jgi:hypothetical protein
MPIRRSLTVFTTKVKIFLSLGACSFNIHSSHRIQKGDTTGETTRRWENLSTPCSHLFIK